jgi:hypothetical protein
MPTSASVKSEYANVNVPTLVESGTRPWYQSEMIQRQLSSEIGLRFNPVASMVARRWMRSLDSGR